MARIAIVQNCLLLSLTCVVVGALLVATCQAARVTDGLVAGYDFREGVGTTVGDHSGNGTPLNLTIHDPAAVTWGQGSITFDEATIISSASEANVEPEGTATKLFDAITETEEITLEAWVKPDNVVENDGPARIMTMSIDRVTRNFTLAQRNVDYEARLRTTTTGTNGNSIKLRTDLAPVDTVVQHVVYTRNTDGDAFIYIDGEEAILGFGDLGEDPIDGDLSNWDDSFDFALGNELTWFDDEPIDFRDWLGTMHLIAVYNRALNQQEVVANFSAGHNASVSGGVGVPGDFDGNGQLDVGDVNALSGEIAAGNNNAAFDLNGDSKVDAVDLRAWVKDLKNTWIGDANLDGEFNSSDFVDVFQAGKFERDVPAGWEEGDWNADLRFGSGDFVVAFQDGGFERGPRAAVAAVPEPSAILLTLPLLMILLGLYRQTLPARLGSDRGV